MRIQDLKYLAAYILPALAFFGLYQGGLWTYGPLVFAFVVVPVLEPFIPMDSSSFSEDEVDIRKHSWFFDMLLLLNIPIVYGMLLAYGIYASKGIYSTYENVGLILSLGTTLGACGINVAHELGHRKSKALQLAAKILLMPSLYNHFYIEHNRGHHKNIGTPEDPATARKGELVFVFWVRSTLHSYINAWKLENKRLGGKWFSINNEMVIYTICSITYILLLLLTFTPSVAASIVLIGIISFLLLETINYIEHYGLQRKVKPNGKYETVKAHHSWNSNHTLGRIILYELTRHSDHHFLAHKEYQILEHHDNSPQLPLGYPGSMLMALVPPLWFKVMDDRVPS